MQDRRQELLATEKPGKLLWKLSYPAAVASTVMAFYNVVDTIFIGHVMGTPGIAGLTIIFPLQILWMAMSILLGMGASSIISRNLGAGNMEKSEKVLGNAVFYSIAVGLVLTVIGLAAPDFWLRLVGASEEVLPYARPYFVITTAGTIIRIFGAGMCNLIRAEGNSRVAMYCMLVPFVLNILLDMVFIIVLNMGIEGAAITTVIAEMSSMGIVIYYYVSGDSLLKIMPKYLLPDWGVFREIMTIGIGPLIMTAGGSLVSIIINRVLVSYGGDIAVASFGMVNRSMTLFFIPILSIGQGLQPILGFAYGANRHERVIASIKVALISATGFACITFLAFFFFAEPVMYLFTRDAELVTVSADAAKILFFMTYLTGFQIIGQTVFQSMGKAVLSFVLSVSRQVLFLVPLVFILSNVWGLKGIWYSFPVSDFLSFLLTVLLALSTVKELKKNAGKSLQPVLASEVVCLRVQPESVFKNVIFLEAQDTKDENLTAVGSSKSE